MNYKPTGIIHITGEPDTGKTLMAVGGIHPKDTAYFFDDVKKLQMPEKEFGLFVDLVSKYPHLKMGPEYYEAIMSEIDKIPAGKYQSIIFDTWAKIGKAIRYYAKANPLLFRDKDTFSKQGMIKGMEEWSETHNVEATIISKIANKTDALFLITHIKEKIIAGAKSGTYEPDCGKSFQRVCNARFWLRHNDKSGVPIALVLKRISKIELTKNGVQPVNVLPRKLTPYEDDTSVWSVINRYYDNPFGNREPTEDEKPTAYELSILDGVLTPDQKEVWKAELKEKERQEQGLELFENEQYEEVKAKVKSYNGLPPMAIAQKINKEFETNYTPKEIEEMLNG